MVVIERQRAKRWSTDRAWKYRIVSSKLAEYIDLHENQTVDISESVYQQSDTGTSIVQNQDNNIGSNSNPSYPQPQAEQAAVGEEEKVEEQDQPTDEEVGEVCIQLRRLSPEISINLQVRSAIRSYWHNVPSALARVKSAIASGWCKQPTGLFVQALKNGARAEGADTVIAAKVYPRPTRLAAGSVRENGGVASYEAE
jgi:hypothetical protein